MKLFSSHSISVILGVLLFSVGAFSIGFRLGSTQAEQQENMIVHQTVAAYFQSMVEVLNLQNAEERQTLILAHSRALLAQLQELHRGQEIIQLIRYLSEITPHVLRADLYEQDPQSEPYYLDFSYTDFSGTEVSSLQLNEAQFSGSTFKHAAISNFQCERCGFWKADFQNARLLSVDLSHSDLTGANFMGAELVDLLLDGAQLGGVTWTDGNICAAGSIGVCQ